MTQPTTEKTVRITYMDNQQIDLVLPLKEVEGMFDALKSNDPYWTENKESAFWAGKDNIRYISVIKYKPQQKIEKKEEKPQTAPENKKEKK